jgi:transmembrane sensor
LLEGRLRVESATSANQPAYLERGQQLVVRTGGAKVRRADGRDEPLGWRSGLLEFDDQPLSEAIAIVNRYSNQQIVLGDPAVGKLKVSGQFRAGDPERFARTFADLHGLAIARKGTRIEIGKGG